MKKLATLRDRLAQALAEDGSENDLTTVLVPGHRRPASAHLLCKAPGVFSGAALIPLIIRLVDPKARVTLLKKEGSAVKKGDILARIRSREDAILAAERLILNLVCHLSGVATLTRRYVSAANQTRVSILDTRKTTPLWRDLERQAVAAGGGVNHRFSLSDAVLVKDNHWRLLEARGSSAEAVYGRGARKRFARARFVAIEAATIAQVWEAIRAGADIILLDNMPSNRLKEAIVLIEAARKASRSGKPLIEVSGGVTPEDARRLARLGVDRISVGALTHSAPALDISLEVD